MVAIKLENDCLTMETGASHMVIRYSGPNPFKAVHKTIVFMRKHWEIEAIGFWERDFRWDMTDGAFYTKSYAQRGIDQFSDVLIETVIQGKQDPKDPSKPGFCEIKIAGFLRTRFGGTGVLNDAKNPLYRLLMYLFNKFFYYQQRRMYLNEWCYKRIMRLKHDYEELLGILPPKPLGTFELEKKFIR